MFSVLLFFKVGCIVSAGSLRSAKPLFFWKLLSKTYKYCREYEDFVDANNFWILVLLLKGLKLYMFKNDQFRENVL